MDNLLLEIIRHKINSLTSTGASALQGKTDFYTIGMQRPQGDRCVCCVPFRTATAYPFSFPFGKKGDLRGALGLKFRSLSGEGSSLTMIPQTTVRDTSSTRGTAWFVSRDEVAHYESLLGDKAVFMPAPLAVLSEVDGDGLVLWCDDDCICALWAEEYEPKLYRCFKTSDATPEGAAGWIRSYAQSVGGSIDPERIRLFNANDITQEELQRAGEATFSAAPSIAGLDFSNGGTSAAERRESMIKSAVCGLKAATAVGLFCLVLSFVLLVQNLHIKPTLATAPSEIYKLALGEESRAPLTSVTRKLSAVSGKGLQMTFDGVLAGIGTTWKTVPDTMRLDALRYGSERTELEGKAQKTEDIQALRHELEKSGFTVRLGDVSQIPGGGMRFSLNLTEGGKSR